MIARHLFTAFVLALVLSRVAPAQRRLPATPPALAPEPGSELTVTLVTFGQGEEVFERFGHNALWFHDANTNQDVAYHWGLFNFGEPGFILRFVAGDPRYSMGPSDANQLIEYERRSGREVILQKLALTPPQAIALRDYVRWNAREENKFYRYDYFRDNCSTRLRDALDHAVDGAIKRVTDTVVTALSYRRESVRLTDGDAPIQIGIDIALGRPADEPLTQWESFFIPMRLRDAVRKVRIPQQDGTSVPLVEREWTLPVPAGITPLVEAPVAPRLTPALALLGIMLGAVVVVLRLLIPRNRAAAWGLAMVGSTWSLITGLIGVVLLFAWLATRHYYWSGNENVLVLTPLSLILVPLTPMALLGRRSERTEQIARVIAALVMMLALFGVVMALIPGGQESRAIVALFAPVHLALAWALSLPRETTQSI
ncbi:MAG: DUF4105 domain-containing protein [bacterium]